jgi:hypothetical protein
LTTEDVLGISDEGKIVLLAVVRSLSDDYPYTSLREIRENVGVLCEEFKLKPIENIEESIQDLWDRQVIDFRSLLEIGISGAPVKDLDKFLDGLIKRLEARIEYGTG